MLRFACVSCATVVLAGLIGCDASEPQETSSATSVVRTSIEVVDPGKNAEHPIAKRSAFPEADETFDKLIPSKTLSDLAQFTADIDPADIPAVVPWDQAKQYVGYEITVEGTIVGVGQSRDKKVNFLNFHKDWRGKFYMVIFDDLANTLDTSVEDLFKDKRIRVKGKVEPHRGNPQMKITSMDQVQFVK